MKFYCFILTLLLSAVSTNCCKSQVPKIGDSLKLEIANWNLEWFGKTGYGPNDEALQQANVLKAIKASDMDIWAFCEVSNNAVFDSLMSNLPEYDYIICPYLPEQKTAVIFKKDQYRLIKSELLGTNNPDSFTTLRFPFLVVLKPLFSIGIDTLNIIVIHLKANFGTNAEKLSAYNSRLRSGEWFKMYLNKEQTNRYCMVAGDWNDDLDESIYNGLPSPYAGMLETDFKFNFITRKFTDKHFGTTTSYPDAIDHQLISMPLQNYLLQNSTSIFYLDQYISNYGSTTSDHYPVYSIFNRNSSIVYKNTINNSFFLYPNPANDQFSVSLNSVDYNAIVKIIDMNGKCLSEQLLTPDESINVTDLSSGYYQVVVICKSGVRTGLLQINH